MPGTQYVGGRDARSARGKGSALSNAADAELREQGRQGEGGRSSPSCQQKGGNPSADKVQARVSSFQVFGARGLYIADRQESKPNMAQAQHDGVV